MCPVAQAVHEHLTPLIRPAKIFHVGVLHFLGARSYISVSYNVSGTLSPKPAAGFKTPRSVVRLAKWADATPSERLKLKKPKPFRFKLVPL